MINFFLIENLSDELVSSGVLVMSISLKLFANKL